MSRPDPQYGQVVRFEYLWASEAAEGYAEGEKRRPCAIIVTIAAKDDKPLRTMLCAITHSQPRPPQEGVELSADAKKAAGLDDEPSWVLTSEVNTVNWDSRRFSRTPSGDWAYGVLPAEVMREIRDKIMARNKAGKMDIVDRENIDRRAR
ncbi:type II toxin-antitoxin system PemK/MazF family toxin [Sphingomonas alba]|uniref:Type II toxin-antitoxin system PemK/MazF family toxin n=1 Tax=Sphingomonas alba TaxID=2908208 RepID=A0ABT0RJT7_9SPHN|nr:type II toxin-antitoxin system PemK/MazF family toxin [Sphingomonas alba]